MACIRWFFEMYYEMTKAIRRKKQLKKWNPLWKIEPIEKANPGWKDYGRRLFSLNYSQKGQRTP
jgi:predicted GIY-YIG superfamily endonuclease